MNLLADIVTAVPDYVPVAVQRRLSGKHFVFDKLPQVIRRRLVTPEKIKVSEHAAKYRIVTDGPHQGPWRHEHAPHTVKIMDTFSLTHVREIWFCGVEQSGKTNTMMNCLHWAADCDPGDIFYLMPTEDTSAKITAGKLKPMVEQSPRLSKYLSGRADDLTLSRIKLNHGVNIRPAYANSPASMATWAAKHCFGDEVDKMPERAGRETDPITLIKKRNRLYKGRYKRFFASTPAGLYVYQGMLACSEVYEYRVRCLHCDELIKMDGDHLVFDDGVSPEDIESGRVTIGYSCNECGVVWDEVDRNRAIRAGRWVCVKGGAPRAPRVGFHHRAWECLDVGLAEIAAAWVKSENGTITEKIAWANGYEAKDYEYDQRDREEDFILRLVDKSMPREIVPRNACCLLMHVDTQQTGFFYQVWAYGFGRDVDIWKIDHGFVMSFDHLKNLAAKSWLDADGKEYRIIGALMDSGGGTNPNNPKHSRTVEVYEFCRQNPIFKPIKGRRSMENPWNAKRLDFYPGAKGKKMPIPGGVVLYTLDVTLFKNELARKLAIEPNSPGSIHLHADMGSGYAKQMCVEYQDDHGWWICPKGKDNHHWDIGVYGMAAVDIFQIRNRQPGGVGPARRIYSKGVKTDG